MERTSMPDSVPFPLVDRLPATLQNDGPDAFNAHPDDVSTCNTIDDAVAEGMDRDPVVVRLRKCLPFQYTRQDSNL